MSYGAPQPKPRRGGGGMVFFIILAIGAFLLFSNRGNQSPRDPGSDPGDILNVEDLKHKQLEKDIFGDSNPDRREMPTQQGSTRNSNDWAIDDVATERKYSPNNDAKSNSRTNSRTNSKTNSKTTKGDWSIEEVDGEKDDGAILRLSQPITNPSPKSDKGWSIEDAGGTKKTEQGDWSIEEVE